MTNDALKQRTNEFALRVIRSIESMALWLELLVESGLVKASKSGGLPAEAGELTPIAVAPMRTARARSATPQSALRSPHSR